MVFECGRVARRTAVARAAPGRRRPGAARRRPPALPRGSAGRPGERRRRAGRGRGGVCGRGAGRRQGQRTRRRWATWPAGRPGHGGDPWRAARTGRPRGDRAWRRGLPDHLRGRGDRRTARPTPLRAAAARPAGPRGAALPGRRVGTRDRLAAPHRGTAEQPQAAGAGPRGGAQAAAPRPARRPGARAVRTAAADRHGPQRAAARGGGGGVAADRLAGHRQRDR